MKGSDYAGFKDPKDIYRGCDFLMLNGALSEQELVRQLTDMKQKGFGAFIARTYVGLESDYPGEDFMSKMSVLISTAEDLGLKIFLQAGYMPDSVVCLPGKYALRSITVNRTEEGGEGEIILSRAGFEYREGIFPDFLDVFSSAAVDYYIRVSYDEMWQRFRTHFGNTVVAVWIDEPSYPSIHLPYPCGIEERFLERYGYSLRENADALFFDRDGYYKVRYDYRRLLCDMLEESFFKRISDWCHEHGLLMSGHLLFEETLTSQLSRAAAVMPYYKYFDVPGVDVLNAQQNWRRSRIKPNTMGEDYRYREVMMTTPLQCASAARQAGKDKILCEMFGVTSECFGPREQKHMLDCMAAHGINMRSMHGVFYSLKGRAKRLYPPHVNYYQPYWSEYSAFNDYTARVSRFASLGEAVKEAVVLHPLESAFAEYTCSIDSSVTGKQPSVDKLVERDKKFARLVRSLVLSGCEVDLGDEGTMAELGSVSNGMLRIGKMQYRTVVLPELSVIRGTTLELLSDFAKQGGRIIALSRIPEMVDGEIAPELVRDKLFKTVHARDTAELCAMLAPRDYSLSTDEGECAVICSRRRSEEGEYYHLVNTDCSEEKHLTLRLLGELVAERWHAETGEKEELTVSYENQTTTLRLTLAEGEGALLVFRRGRKNTESLSLPRIVYPLDLAFSAERTEPNVMLLEYCSYKKENENFGDELPILAVQHILEEENYRGNVTLRYTFRSECSFPLSLALEDAAEAEIHLNGQLVPSNVTGWYLSRDFEKIELGECVFGENELTVRRRFTPPSRTYGGGKSLFMSRGGTYLECMYLLGEFAVKMIPEPERNGCLRYSRTCARLAREEKFIRGELTSAGYPFYAGGMRLSCEFFFEGQTEGCRLSLSDACISGVRAELNGRDLGYLFAHPYSFNISSALKNGKNELKLVITNTLRNLIGPHHLPYGERGGVRGDYDNSDLGWMGAWDKDDKTWYTSRSTDTPLWTESYLFAPFGVYGMKIEK